MMEKVDRLNNPVTSPSSFGTVELMQVQHIGFIGTGQQINATRTT